MSKCGIALRGVSVRTPTSRRLRSIFFLKIDRIHSFDIRYSLFQGFYFDLTSRFFGRRRRWTLTPETFILWQHVVRKGPLLFPSINIPASHPVPIQGFKSSTYFLTSAICLIRSSAMRSAARWAWGRATVTCRKFKKRYLKTPVFRS